MAPKKGTKRTAAVDAEVVEAKRIKETLKSYGVSKTLFDGVIEALHHPLVDVPNSARDMLIASVLQGICVPVNQRHEFQIAYVEMVGQTLQGVLSKLKIKVSDATAEVSRIEEAKKELQAEVQASEEALHKAMEGEKKGKEDLAEATRCALAQKTTLTQREKLQTEGDAAYEAAKKHKAALEAALQEEFRALGDGSVEGDEAKSQYKKLESLAKTSGLENTLLAALPTSILKPPSQRGSFDAMVVAQLQEGLTTKCTQLAAEITEAQPAAMERAKAVHEAKENLEAAKVHQEKTAEHYRETQNVLKSCQEAKKEAEQKVTDAEPTLQSAQQVLADVESELEQYQIYNWSCFEQLRDHSTEPQAPKEPAEVAAPTEAAVATAGA